MLCPAAACAVQVARLMEGPVLEAIKQCCAEVARKLIERFRLTSEKPMVHELVHSLAPALRWQADEAPVKQWLMQKLDNQLDLTCVMDMVCRKC